MARILVIDDDDEIRQMVEKMMVRAGHEVRLARNGEVALRLLAEALSDLIITDIFMPEKEGIETIREIKRDFPGVNIIAMSGGIAAMDSSVALRMAQGLGADRTVPKPIGKDELLAAVDALLASHNPMG
jgi:DNA-binding response OmpR family regulator